MESSQEDPKEAKGFVNQENVRAVLNLYDEPVNTRNIYPGKRARPQTGDTAPIPDATTTSSREDLEDDAEDEDYSPEMEQNETNSGDEEEALDEVKDVVLVRAELVDSPVSARNILTQRMRKRLAIARGLNTEGEGEDEDDEEEDPDYVPKEEEEVLSGMDPLVQAQMDMFEKKKRENDKSKSNKPEPVVEQVGRTEDVPKVVSKILSLTDPKEEIEVTQEPVVNPPASSLSKHQVPVKPEGLEELKTEIGPLIEAQMEKMKHQRKLKSSSLGKKSKAKKEDEEDSFIHDQRETLRTKSISEAILAEPTHESHPPDLTKNDSNEDHVQEDSATASSVAKENIKEESTREEEIGEILEHLSNTEDSADPKILEEEVTDDEEEELPNLPQYSDPFWCFCTIL